MPLGLTQEPGSATDPALGTENNPYGNARVKKLRELTLQLVRAPWPIRHYSVQEFIERRPMIIVEDMAEFVPNHIIDRIDRRSNKRAI